MTPLVSILIPCGPRHRSVVGHAVASALGGTVQQVQVIVVNDTGAPLGFHSSDPRLFVVEARPARGLRPAIARNVGLAHARAPLLVNLDADDYLLPDGLGVLLRAHAGHDRAYTYGQHYGTRPDGSPVADSRSRPIANGYGVGYDDWDYTAANLHAISALVPTEAARDVGGFDEGAPGWDDWSFFARMRQAGYCGYEVKAPVFVYRVHLSAQHHTDNAGGLALMAQARARIIGEGWNPMGCGCGGGAAVAKAASQEALLGGAIPAAAWGDETMRVLEFIGRGEGAQTFRVNGRSYRAGRNAAVRYLSTGHTLDERDIAGLLELGFFREVPPAPAYAEPPAPIEPDEGEASVVVGTETPGDEAALEADASGVARPSKSRRVRAKGGEDAAA